MTGAVQTIFEPCGLDRSKVRWEDRLFDLTPVEKVGGIYFKREDKFAPLGYGGINGSKLRQLVWLLEAQQHRPGVLTACSVLSPQGSMAALVSKHFEMPCTIMFGATSPRSAIKHENVSIACEAGARFLYHTVAYNPALQGAMRDAHEEQYKNHYVLNYGITCEPDASDADIEGFHAVGAEQVRNIPDDVKTLVMPAGSCNSCVSVLYGLSKYPPASLERVLLMGIGPTRLWFIEQRLAAIERATGTEIRSLFRRKYHQHPESEIEHQHAEGRFLLEHIDLHATKYVTYQAKMPFRYRGIDFHPTYEGKLMTYMSERRTEFEWFWKGGESMFWIVGSAPSLAPMTKHGLGWLC